jgi:hypothetical protein
MLNDWKSKKILLLVFVPYMEGTLCIVKIVF